MYTIFSSFIRHAHSYLDDLSEGGKRVSGRKWREWSLILTGSQLLFYRDSSVALTLLSHLQSGVLTDSVSAHLAYLKPEETISVKGAIAVFDSSYTKVSIGNNPPMIFNLIFFLAT